MPKERLLQSQQEDRAKGLTEHHIQQLKVYFTQYIYDLANAVHVRQRVAATAVVYFRRLFAGSSFSAHDPHLVAPGCLYLAGKVEESVVAARALLASMRRLRPAWPYELRDLLDIEMVILEELDTHLVVFSPYLSLTKILDGGEAMVRDLGQNAWAALNDAYRTDAPLVHAPHVLALGCLYLASVVAGVDITAWLEGVDVDTSQVYAVSLELITLYETYRVIPTPDEAARLLALLWDGGEASRSCGKAMASPGAPAQVSVLILGAGPTGLGAATRLHQHGHCDWLLLDQAAEAGGLACTAVTPEGFLFDMGGHVIFSHWAYFDQLLNAALPGGDDAWNTLQRVSYVQVKGRWVPYPFQNNISALDEDDQLAAAAAAGGRPANFEEWILRTMGRGIADLFMRPYNFKVWACPPAEMQCAWLGERVATVDVRRAIANVVHRRADAGWGPNAVFRFPRRGGTGAIWKAVASLLPRDKQRYGARVVALDADARRVTLEDGSIIGYRQLLSTLPLDTTLTWLGRRDWADALVHSSTHIIGVGVRGTCPHGSKCWLYFPEPTCPFYRATVFSNYADANCPPPDARLPTLCRADVAAAAAPQGAGSGGGGGGDRSDGAAPGPYWSLMFEVSESRQKPVDASPVLLGGAGTWPAVVADTLRGALATQLLAPGDEVVSLFHRRLEHGYPTPSLGRDAVLAQALPWLQARGVWSRGRFGSYKYEVANQDHSLMLGVEAADAMLFGTRETTLQAAELQLELGPPSATALATAAQQVPDRRTKRDANERPIVIAAMAAVNYVAAYVVLGVYLAAVCGAGLLGAFHTLARGRAEPGTAVRQHYVAGAGLATVTWFFTMSASLFSGYTVSGIVAEAYTLGWVATRWIPAGVGVYMGFLFMAPRFHGKPSSLSRRAQAPAARPHAPAGARRAASHRRRRRAPRGAALGKSRGYMTVSEFIFDRYLPNSGAPWVAHTLRVVSFIALQLPIFTYLITQFQAVGTEVRTFTAGAVSPTAAVLAAAAVLLLCDLMGGMRAVAYTDVLQGFVLLVGSIIFLVVQRTELGGLPAAAAFYRDPANAALPNVGLMQNVPPAPTIVAYADFVFKTTIAATMFPHLTARLFAAKDAAVMRRGMATMNFSFFIIQLSSMITGWVAISALAGPLPKGTSVFSAVLLKVAAHGTGQSVLSALLLASAISAMMSTADSALLAFSSMWVRDLFKPYLCRRATEAQQIWFGRLMSVVGLCIGVLLGLLTIERGVPNLTGLFSLQNVTPIHIAPAVWLGLHWRGLRGEAVAAGMVAGLATTVGLVFSPINVKLAAGLDQTACGLSTAMIGFFVNITVTVGLGLAMQHAPRGFGAAFARVASALPAFEHVDVGTVRCTLLNPWLWAAMVPVLLFTVPFTRRPLSPNAFVGDMAEWPFVALLLSGVLACLVAFAYSRLWTDWAEPGLPDGAPAGKGADDVAEGTRGASDAAAPAAVAGGKDATVGAAS
ncbi:cyclin-C1-1 [Scenedesmus sp. PABB004]|nr:cyclin-C1-1 [Scenedesmus sp. PABB004]